MISRQEVGAIGDEKLFAPTPLLKYMGFEIYGLALGILAPRDFSRNQRFLIL